jgi:hypothetical protein
MTRLINGPQGITLGSIFLRIVAEVVPLHMWTLTLGDEPDEVLYPNGLGYVRWTLPATGEVVSPDYQVVSGSYDELSTTEDSLQSQPWWGNENLARQIAQEISGGPGGSPEYGNPNNGFFGPWLAYGFVENAGIAAVAYQGNSGVLTGVGTFQSPQNPLSYLVENQTDSSGRPALSGPWLAIYQRELAIPIDYSGTAALGFDALEYPGVTISGEIISI